MWKKKWDARSPLSREAAQEYSPGRKPWLKKWNERKPRRGERIFVTQSLQGLCLYHFVSHGLRRGPHSFVAPGMGVFAPRGVVVEFRGGLSYEAGFPIPPLCG